MDVSHKVISGSAAQALARAIKPVLEAVAALFPGRVELLNEAGAPLAAAGSSATAAAASGCTALVCLPSGEKLRLSLAGIGATPELAARIGTAIESTASAVVAEIEAADRMAADLLESYEEINFFYDLAGAFQSATNEDELAHAVLSRGQAICDADRGAVVMFEPVPRVSAGSLDWAEAGLDLASIKSGLEARTASEVRGLSLSVSGTNVFAAPVPAKGRIAGAVILGRTGRRPFNAADINTAQSLGSHAGVFIDNYRQALQLVHAAEVQRQLETAEAVQHSLLPRQSLAVPGFEITSRYRASGAIGGDYYDLFFPTEGTLAVVVADVSGHSLSSGLLMATARSALRVLAKGATSPARVLTALNEALYPDLDENGVFISACLAFVDTKTGNSTYASAGHNPMYVVRTQGEISEMGATGVPLGIAPVLRLYEDEFSFEAGSLMALYTDGITEASSRGGIEFGSTRLKQMLAELRERPVEWVLQDIIKAVEEHATAGIKDDFTIMLARRYAARTAAAPRA